MPVQRKYASGNERIIFEANVLSFQGAKIKLLELEGADMSRLHKK